MFAKFGKILSHGYLGITQTVWGHFLFDTAVYDYLRCKVARKVLDFTVILSCILRSHWRRKLREILVFPSAVTWCEDKVKINFWILYRGRNSQAKCRNIWRIKRRERSVWSGLISLDWRQVITVTCFQCVCLLVCACFCVITCLYASVLLIVYMLKCLLACVNVRIWVYVMVLHVLL